MRFALINSGLGLLATASELRKLRPDADLVIAVDPDGMPWGPRTPEDIAQRSLDLARSAASYEPDVIVMACNTGSVHALPAMRAEFEPEIPIVGTVPAIKPAAAAARSVAVWSTVATSASAYLRSLIDEFGANADVTPVPCPGLATAIDAGDEAAIARAIADAAALTPADCGALVLGCTEYELVGDRIGAAVPGALLFGTATAVAAQALRRAGQTGRNLGAPGAASLSSAGGGSLGPVDVASYGSASGGLLGSAGVAPLGAAGGGLLGSTAGASVGSAGGASLGSLTVLLSGRPGELPPAAMTYPQGRALAQLDVGRDPTAGVTV